MAAKLDIIQAGYARKPLPDAMFASGSSCLISTSQDRILFDTMGPWEKGLLVSLLAREGIHPEDITYLVCSHAHPDHIGNNNLFTRADWHVVGTSVYNDAIFRTDSFNKTGSYIYTTARNETVEVVQRRREEISSHAYIEFTPGHTLECVSVFLDNCENYGTVVLAGDLFECEQDVNDETIWLGAGSHNPNLQRAHRTKVYNSCDWIMPGHGHIFKTDRRNRVIF